LDGDPVPRLGPDLQPFLRETGRPQQLDENSGIAFQGHNVLGVGFTLTPDEAHRMIVADKRNADVLAPYVIGADLNRRPDASASRWIINFKEWPQDMARSYALPWAKLERDVLPERAKKDEVKYPRMVLEWWKFWQYRQGLEETVRDLDSVLALSLHGNVALPLRLPANQVFAHACGVFALDDFASLALLSSSVHQVWTIRYTSTMRTDIRYAPSDVFLTLPRPQPNQSMEELGEVLDRERRQLMLGRSLGLTKLYNLVHNPSVMDPAIVRMRDIHDQIDIAVLEAYGWSDLDLELGHHQTKIGIRWTMSSSARFEVLDRLLVENHLRAARQG